METLIDLVVQGEQADVVELVCTLKFFEHLGGRRCSRSSPRSSANSPRCRRRSERIVGYGSTEGGGDLSLLQEGADDVGFEGGDSYYESQTSHSATSASPSSRATLFCELLVAVAQLLSPMQHPLVLAFKASTTAAQSSPPLIAVSCFGR